VEIVKVRSTFQTTDQFGLMLVAAFAFLTLCRSACIQKSRIAHGHGLVSDSCFTDLSAGADLFGGAIFSEQESLELSGCTFRGCEASVGGGFRFIGGRLLVVRCCLEHCKATEIGSAFDAVASLDVSWELIDNLVLSGFCSSGTLHLDTSHSAVSTTFTRTNVTNNDAKIHSSAVWFTSPFTLNFSFCDLARNKAVNCICFTGWRSADAASHCLTVRQNTCHSTGTFRGLLFKDEKTLTVFESFIFGNDVDFLSGGLCDVKFKGCHFDSFSFSWTEGKVLSEDCVLDASVPEQPSVAPPTCASQARPSRRPFRLAAPGVHSTSSPSLAILTHSKIFQNSQIVQSGVLFATFAGAPSASFYTTDGLESTTSFGLTADINSSDFFSEATQLFRSQLLFIASDLGSSSSLCESLEEIASHRFTASGHLLYSLVLSGSSGFDLPSQGLLSDGIIKSLDLVDSKFVTSAELKKSFIFTSSASLGVSQDRLASIQLRDSSVFVSFTFVSNILEPTSSIALSRMIENAAISGHLIQTRPFAISNIFESNALLPSGVLISHVVHRASDLIAVSDFIAPSGVIAASYSIEGSSISISLRLVATVGIKNSFLLLTLRYEGSLFLKRTRALRSDPLVGSDRHRPTALVVNSASLHISKGSPVSALHVGSAAHRQSELVNKLNLSTVTLGNELVSPPTGNGALTLVKSSGDSSLRFTATTVFRTSDFPIRDDPNAKGGAPSEAGGWLGATLGGVAALVVLAVLILVFLKHFRGQETSEETGGVDSCEVTDSLEGNTFYEESPSACVSQVWEGRSDRHGGFDSDLMEARTRRE
jgi:hypothetical protein